ncbi:MAG TPA: hypothetical protein VF746_01485 [Longimicrobium sp.]|jgi:hypothetical protein
MGRYEIALLPFAQLSPQACEALAVALEEAQEVLISWNLRQTENGRIARAIRQLHTVAMNGSFGSTKAQLYETARAIFLANDLYVITRTLPSERDDPIAQELAAILGGSLTEDTHDRRAYEMQSQFWFGTLLAQSELHPTLLAGVGRRPDFIVTVDNVRLAVEVKRPTSISAAEYAVRKAHRQIRELGIPGIVALDLSDAIGLRQLDTERARASGAVRPHDLARQPFNEAAEQVRHYIDSNRPNRFERLLGLIFYARYCVWHAPESSDLDFGLFLNGHIFENVAGGIYDHFAIRMLGRLVPGIENLTGNPFIRE